MSRVVPLTHGQVMGEVCEEPGRGKKHATGMEYPDIQHPLGRSKRPEQNQGRTPRFKQMGYRLTKLVQLVQLRPPNQIAPGVGFCTKILIFRSGIPRDHFYMNTNDSNNGRPR